MKWPTSEKMNRLARDHMDGLYHRISGMTKFTCPVAALEEAEFLAGEVQARMSVINKGDHMIVMQTATVRDKSQILETIKP